jgi:hypothetical protein
VEISLRVIYDDVLNAELGQPIGGVLFCVFVVRIKDDAGSAIDGFFQFIRKRFDPTVL